jgi:dihydroxyacetone kinase-like predicted kinase
MSFGGDVVSVYYGEDVTLEMADEIGGYITGKYPGSEVEVYAGKQPLYDYILSVE